MFEQYDNSARRTVFFARYEAGQLGAREITVEHLLLGLIREDPLALLPFLAEVETLRQQVEAGLGQRFCVELAAEMLLARSAKKSLQAALDEARRLQHKHVTMRHLLFGIVSQIDSEAARLLAAHGMNPESVRATLC